MVPSPSLPHLQGRKRLKLFPFIALSVLAILGLGSLLILRSSGGDKLVWLTPAQYSESVRPGTVSRARELYRKWVRPVINKFRGTPPALLINSSFYEIRPAEHNLEIPGTLLGTNADGTRLWMCSEAESLNFDARLSSIQLEDVRLTSNSAKPYVINFTVQSGFLAQILPSSASVPIRDTNSSNPGAISFVQVGTRLDIKPKLKSDAIELLGQFESTGLREETTNAPNVKTNFLAAFQATIPKGNALIIRCSDPGKVHSVENWIVLRLSREVPKGSAKK